MEAFALLLDRLYYTHSNLAKTALLKAYLGRTPDPDRGWAIAALAGEMRFEFFKRHTITALIRERVDPYLYDISRDYVGETSETVAHLWPPGENATRLNRIPSLHEVVENFSTMRKEEVRNYLVLLLDNMQPAQRWALLKLGTQGLRVGVSARFIKNVLAEFGGVDVKEIESLWHGLEPPYTELFAWLEKNAAKPDVSKKLNFHPVMLSHPLEDRDVERITPETFYAEWKYDGIRVQIVSSSKGAALFTRTGDNISHSFPDIMEHLNFNAVLDGELLVKHHEKIAPFNDLQQRLNKKTPSKKLIEQYPAHLMLYDILEADNQDMRELSLVERREQMQRWLDANPFACGEISPILDYTSIEELESYRAQANREEENFIEGLMLKRKDSAYIPGRPKGYWYKWKRSALLIDAVLMYAQRGSGKRSSFYSDYTFGLWKGEELLPIGKAYSGFTDEELKKLDHWIRNHTTQRFGPVRCVDFQRVLEIAFDSAQLSNRHKSGFALRFPRVNRIRWDKPAKEADQMETLAKMV